MPLVSTRRTGLVDQVIAQLRSTITRGEWPIGTRIPTEAELVEALGVGRNTVREAVRALAHGGLLEVRQGDGTYVRATSEVSGAVQRLGGAKLREVLQVRRLLEVEGARLAAAARTEADLAELRELQRTRDTDQRDRRFADFARSDSAFHLAVVRASHNAVLIELYRGLSEVVVASIAATNDEPEHAEEIWHGALVDAIAAGDVEAAGEEAGAFFTELLCRLGRRP